LKSLGFGNEATREFYIDDLLLEVLMFADPGDKLAVSIEQNIEHDLAWGNVEFVVVKKSPEKLPYALVIEAKKSDFEAGRAQLYMELHSAYKTNFDFNPKVPPIFGVVTDAADWIFVRYDGHNFVESNKFIIQDSNDESGLQTVFKVLGFIIQTQVAKIDELSNH